ncbi:MAG TPA: DUF366 family protein [candidate division Zixibacteria bacterium]|nr:DUF366 family protein [candidate division Zixibacteria bacterium]
MSISNMKFKILPAPRSMTEAEMHPHWALKNFGLQGDNIVAFRGAFEVPPEKWFDLDAIMHGQEVLPGEMLHFVIEHFDCNIREILMRQYILVSVVEEKLIHRMNSPDHCLVRLGEDLFDGENRISVTGCTITPVSAKLHLGLYLDSSLQAGVHGIKAYNVKALELAELVINQYRAEMRRLEEKSWRVRPII